MISLIETLEESSIGLNIFPKNVVIVSIDFEKRSKTVQVMLERENLLEIAKSTKLFFTFEKNHPVFGAQHLKTVSIVKLLQTVYVFGVVLLILATIAEEPLFFFFLDFFNTFTSCILNSNQIQNISEKSMFDFSVHW